MELHKFHVVITESLEYLLDEVLLKFSYSRRPRIKSGDRGRMDLGMASVRESEVRGSQEGAAADDDQISRDAAAAAEAEADADAEAAFMDGFIVTRTFLCEAPLLLDARTVAQSSTEVVVAQSESLYYYGSCRGLNPRRVA